MTSESILPANLRSIVDRFLARALHGRIEAQAQADLSSIEEMARSHITSHGHGFSLFLRESSKELLSGLAAEIDLFATRYQAVGSTLMNALQAPRYSGPLMHWTEARKA